MPFWVVGSAELCHPFKFQYYVQKTNFCPPLGLINGFFPNKNWRHLTTFPKSLVIGLVALLILLSTRLSSQEFQCGFEGITNQFIQNDPNYLQFFQASAQQAVANAPDEYVIPVVVHIFYSAPAGNIDESQVFNAIYLLNQGFNGTFGGEDTKIRFKLAKYDPSGCPTSGIVRVPETVPCAYHTEFFGGFKPWEKSVWPQDRYLNIWVVEGICGFGVGGFSSYHPGWVDQGIVIRNDIFGNIGTASGNPQMHALTHEAGHFFNLWHIWGPDVETPSWYRCHDETQNFTNGDFVDDTPPTNPDNFPPIVYTFCENALNIPPRNSCYAETPDLIDDLTNFMGYVFKCHSRFTPHQISLRMIPALNSGRASLWDPFNLDCTGVEEFFSKNIEITQHTTWTTTNLPNGGEITLDRLVIRKGFSLVVESGVIIHFRKPCDNGSNLIVEPDARLILYGAILTNDACNPTGHWKGIEIAGKSIGPSDNPGTLITGDDAVIEKAEIGARNSAPFNGYMLIGGKMDCSDTKFNNNYIGVSFARHLDKIDPSSPPVYVWSTTTDSRFVNCEFEYNGIGNSYPATLPPFLTQAQIAGINGVLFHHSTFKSKLLVDAEWKEGGTGISAYDAKFDVVGTGNDQIKEFSGLWRAIDAQRIFKNQPFSVKKCAFESCNIAIWNGGISFSPILFNKFYLGSRPNIFFFPAEDQIGVYYEGNAEILIQENQFIDNYQGANDIENTVGICSNDLGSTNNVIRKNKFIGVNIGNVANNTNFGDIFTGLVYECNENQGVRNYDFAVTDGGIRKLQGGIDFITFSKISAGNTFAYSAPPTEDDFKNNGTNIDYQYLNLPNQEPLEVSSSSVGKVVADNQNLCTQEYISGEAPPRTQWNAALTTVRGDYTIVQGQYRSSVDNGDTEGLLYAVSAATEGSVNALFNQLNPVSPWLSAEVFKALVNKDPVIPISRTFNLLFLNPDVLKSPEFASYLDNSGKFSAAELQTLRDSSSNQTLRTTLENKLVAYKSALDDLLTKYISSFTGDSVALAPQESQALLLDYGYYQTDLLYAENMLADGLYQETLSFLDSMALHYPLSSAELSEHVYFKDLVQILIGAFQNNQTIFTLDSSSISALKTVSMASQGNAKVTSDKLLVINGALNSFGGPCTLLPPQFVFSQRPVNPDATAKIAEQRRYARERVKVFPNPAKGSVQFAFEAAGECGWKDLTVYNMLGKMVAHASIPESASTYSLDISNLLSGVYVYRVSDKSGHVEAGRILVKN